MTSRGAAARGSVWLSDVEIAYSTWDTVLLAVACAAIIDRDCLMQVPV